MKLAQYKYFNNDDRLVWLRLLQFGKGVDERAVVDISAEYSKVAKSGVFLSKFVFLVQFGGDALFQIHCNLFKVGFSLSIWSV